MLYDYTKLILFKPFISIFKISRSGKLKKGEKGDIMVECSKTVINVIELGMEEDQHARILEDQFYDMKNRGELIWGD